MLRSYSFTVDFDRQWQALALQKAPSQLCKDVLQLSDQFIQEKQLRTPWNRTNLAAAYELYFHPLNYLRARRSLERAGRHNFFAGLTHVIDWGAGLGAFTRALLDELPPSNHTPTHFPCRRRELLGAGAAAVLESRGQDSHLSACGV